MDTPISELRAYIGRPVSDLPTPSVILRQDVLEKNCSRMHESVAAKGLGFRAHVKTLKVDFLSSTLFIARKFH